MKSSFGVKRIALLVAAIVMAPLHAAEGDGKAGCEQGKCNKPHVTVPATEVPKPAANASVTPVTPPAPQAPKPASQGIIAKALAAAKGAPSALVAAPGKVYVSGKDAVTGVPMQFTEFFKMFKSEQKLWLPWIADSGAKVGAFIASIGALCVGVKYVYNSMTATATAVKYTIDDVMEDEDMAKERLAKRRAEARRRAAECAA